MQAFRYLNVASLCLCGCLGVCICIYFWVGVRNTIALCRALVTLLEVCVHEPAHCFDVSMELRSMAETGREGEREKEGK